MLRRWYFIILLLAVACAPMPKPQESCNFVMNSLKQRVSWKGNLPVVFHFHESFPDEYRNSVRSAFAAWEVRLQKQFFVLSDVEISGTNSAVKDGKNVLYFKTDWEDDKVQEQARTSLHWLGNMITEGDIQINARNHDFSILEVDGEVHMESLIIHESGHVLGLAHIEEDHEDNVMSAYLESGKARLDPSNLEVDSLRCEY